MYRDVTRNELDESLARMLEFALEGLLRVFLRVINPRRRCSAVRQYLHFCTSKASKLSTARQPDKRVIGAPRKDARAVREEACECACRHKKKNR